MTKQEIKANLLIIEAEIKAVQNMIWDLAGQPQTKQTDKYMAALWQDLKDKNEARDRYKSIAK